MLGLETHTNTHRPAKLPTVARSKLVTLSVCVRTVPERTDRGHLPELVCIFKKPACLLKPAVSVCMWYYSLSMSSWTHLCVIVSVCMWERQTESYLAKAVENVQARRWRWLSGEEQTSWKPIQHSWLKTLYNKPSLSFSFSLAPLAPTEIFCF